MSYTVQQVENPSEDQIIASANLFYDLMHEDKAALSLSGGDKTLIKVQAAALPRAGALAGEYYAATNGEGEIVGFTMWMPPGQDMFSTEEQRNLGFYDFMARLPEEGKEYFKTTYLAHFPGFVSGILGPTGKVDSWWMHMCMVRSDYQRKGIAKALINLVREKAKKSGETLACGATDDSNVPVYKAIGFSHRGQIVIPSPWGDWPAHLFTLDTSKI